MVFTSISRRECTISTASCAYSSSATRDGIFLLVICRSTSKIGPNVRTSAGGGKKCIVKLSASQQSATSLACNSSFIVSCIIVSTLSSKLIFVSCVDTATVEGSAATVAIDYGVRIGIVLD